MNFPNFFLTKEEERLQMKQLDLPYSPNDPSNYYCLGIYNEETQQWKCISRNLLEINDNIIEFTFPYPGIFAVIFSPKPFLKNDTNECDFFCQYRKTLIMIFVFLIPLLLLSFSYIWKVYSKQIKNQQAKLENAFKSAAGLGKNLLGDVVNKVGNVAQISD